VAGAGQERAVRAAGVRRQRARSGIAVDHRRVARGTERPWPSREGAQSSARDRRRRALTDDDRRGAATVHRRGHGRGRARDPACKDARIQGSAADRAAEPADEHDRPALSRRGRRRGRARTAHSEHAARARRHKAPPRCLGGHRDAHHLPHAQGPRHDRPTPRRVEPSDRRPGRCSRSGPDLKAARAPRAPPADSQRRRRSAPWRCRRRKRRGARGCRSAPRTADNLPPPPAAGCRS